MLIGTVAMVGQVCFMFRRAAFVLSELNAFLASTRRIASVSLSKKVSLIACIAASIPAT